MDVENDMDDADSSGSNIIATAKGKKKGRTNPTIGIIEDSKSDVIRGDNNQPDDSKRDVLDNKKHVKAHLKKSDFLVQNDAAKTNKDYCKSIEVEKRKKDSDHDSHSFAGSIHDNHETLVDLDPCHANHSPDILAKVTDELSSISLESDDATNSSRKGDAFLQSEEAMLTSREYQQLAKKLRCGTTPCDYKRRIAWRVFLDILPLNKDVVAVSDSVTEMRKTYFEKRSKYFGVFNISYLKSFNPQIHHPLNPSKEKNPWTFVSSQSDLLEEIWKDIMRTFPEISVIRQPKVREALQRILFVWSCEFPSISYRQGMNELVALCYAATSLYAIEKDSTNTQELTTLTSPTPESWRYQMETPLKSKSSSYDGIIEGQCYVRTPNPAQHLTRASTDVSRNDIYLKIIDSEDENDIEADVYILLTRMMELGMRDLYIPTPSMAPPKPSSSDLSPNKITAELDLLRRNSNKFIERKSPENGDCHQNVQRSDQLPLILLCDKIFDDLKLTDSNLYDHLCDSQLEPQLFLLRWTRLLFCREFTMSRTIMIWDAFLGDRFLAVHDLDDETEDLPTNSIGDEDNDGVKSMDNVKPFLSAFPLVEYICLSMFLYIREELLNSLGFECLRLCLNYPEVNNPSKILKAAVSLRTIVHLKRMTGNDQKLVPSTSSVYSGFSTFPLRVVSDPVTLQDTQMFEVAPSEGSLDDSSASVRSGPASKRPSVILKRYKLTDNQFSFGGKNPIDVIYQNMQSASMPSKIAIAPKTSSASPTESKSKFFHRPQNPLQTLQKFMK